MPPRFPDEEELARGTVRWAIIGALVGLAVFGVALLLDNFSVGGWEGPIVGALFGAGGYLFLTFAASIVEWAF